VTWECELASIIEIIGWPLPGPIGIWIKMSKTIVADPHLIFQSAEAFFGVGLRLKEPYERGEVLPLAMAVNAALALELYLKCLRTIEAGNFFIGHEFDDQFRDLETATQAEIRRRHDEVVATMPIFSTLRAQGISSIFNSFMAK
jgi:hypothetical protein